MQRERPEENIIYIRYESGRAGFIVGELKATLLKIADRLYTAGEGKGPGLSVDYKLPDGTDLGIHTNFRERRHRGTAGIRFLVLGTIPGGHKVQARFLVCKKFLEGELSVARAMGLTMPKGIWRGGLK